jgi:hypothetical protein
MKNQVAIALIVIVAVLSSAFVSLIQQNSIQSIYDSGYKAGWTRGYNTGYSSGSVYGTTTNLFTNVTFNSTETGNFESIRNRLAVINTDPDFPGDRTLHWISMRNSSSASWDPYQKSMEYLCFWRGQGGTGEWEAVVSIYNSPGSLNNYVVEIARFTWHQIQVTLDGNLIADFPQVTKDTTSLGHTTFRVQA